MWSRPFLAAAAVVGTVLAMAPPASAQFQRGSIYGAVTDASGGVLPGVTVTLESSALLQPQTFVTAADGTYRFPALSPGVYNVTIDLAGFRSFLREGVQVSGGSNVR